MLLADLFKVNLEVLPCRALGERAIGDRFYNCFHILAPYVWLCRSWCRAVARLERRSSEAFSQRRNPPRKALALSPARQPGGNFSRCFTLPPPRTTSSGSNAAIKRATTSATLRRHFCFSHRSNPRSPTYSS